MITFFPIRIKSPLAGTSPVFSRLAFVTVVVVLALASWTPAHAALSFFFDPSSQTVAPPGGQATVRVAISPVADLNSFQLSLHWDPTVLFYSSGTISLPGGVGFGSLGTANTATGDLGMSWYYALGATLNSDTTVLTLLFDTSSSEGQSTLNFSDFPTGREVVAGGADITGTFSWEYGSVTLSNVPEPVNAGLLCFVGCVAVVGVARWARTRFLRGKLVR